MSMEAKAEPTEASEPAATKSVTDGVLPNGSSDSAGRGLPRCDSGVSDVGREKPQRRRTNSSTLRLRTRRLTSVGNKRDSGYSDVSDRGSQLLDDDDFSMLVGIGENTGDAEGETEEDGSDPDEVNAQPRPVTILEGDGMSQEYEGEGIPSFSRELQLSTGETKDLIDDVGESALGDSEVRVERNSHTAAAKRLSTGSNSSSSSDDPTKSATAAAKRLSTGSISSSSSDNFNPVPSVKSATDTKRLSVLSTRITNSSSADSLGSSFNSVSSTNSAIRHHNDNEVFHDSVEESKQPGNVSFSSMEDDNDKPVPVATSTPLKE